MSTYVVRLWSRPGRALRGRARHVATGEEIAFHGEAGLIAFLEGTHAATGLAEALETLSPAGDEESGNTGREKP